MGLLDMVGGMLGGQQGGGQPNSQAALIAAVIGMLGSSAQSGGLAGLIEKFQAHGMGEIADSWVSTGDNLPLSQEQLGQVMDHQQMGDLAAKFGLSTGALGAQVSQLLPQAVDRLTPGGRLPVDGVGNFSELLSLLTPR